MTEPSPDSRDSIELQWIRECVGARESGGSRRLEVLRCLLLGPVSMPSGNQDAQTSNAQIHTEERL